MDAPIRFTAAAAQKIHALMHETPLHGESSLPDTAALRVFVQGGGCSGFQYGFSFEESPGEEDLLLLLNMDGQQVDGLVDDAIHVVIDSLSLQYLQEAEIDYQEGLEGAQFTVKNPNAQSSCGCGSSFSV